MDPDEIESILNGGDGDGPYAHLARLVRTAQAPATSSELAREDLAVAAFRHSIRPLRRERVLSRFTPIKVAAAAAAFIVAGGGFTAALTHAFTHASTNPTTNTVKSTPSEKVGSVARAGSSSSQLSTRASTTGSGVPKASKGSSGTIGSGTGSDNPNGKQNGKGKHHDQGNGTSIAPGLNGSAVPASYRGLCVSYSKAITALQSSPTPTKKVLKLQSSQRFMRLAESALNQGLTVPQFCSDVLGTKVPNLNLPESGLNSASSTENGSTVGSSSNSKKSDSGGGSNSSGSNQDGGDGGIVSASTPNQLP